jgi:hypothetical protein
MVKTPPPCPLGASQIARELPVRTEGQMRVRQTVCRIFGPCHLRRRHRHGCPEGQGCAGLVATLLCLLAARVSRLGGLLPPLLQGLRRDCYSLDDAATIGGLPVVNRSRGGVPHAPTSANHGSNVATVEFHQRLHHRMRHFRIQFGQDVASRRWADRVLQNAASTTPLEIGSLRA